MNFGYLITVNSDTEVDYLKMADALCMSIKSTQKHDYSKVALVIDDKSKLGSRDFVYYDHIIEWNKESGWNGRSWMDQLSPFEYTVCLDADMLFLSDYSKWIETLIENFELFLPNKAYTYKKEIITSDSYRKTFTANQLPNLYSFFTFFKKNSTIAEEFFTLNRYIIKNPTEFSNLYLSKRKPKIIGTDEAFALSAKILGITDEITANLEFPRIVHLKSLVQNCGIETEKVTDTIGFYVKENSKIKIGNFIQADIVHYVEKDLIDDQMLDDLKESFLKKND
jgi:hypothetical protein